MIPDFIGQDAVISYGGGEKIKIMREVIVPAAPGGEFLVVRSRNECCCQKNGGNICRFRRAAYAIAQGIGDFLQAKAIVRQ